MASEKDFLQSYNNIKKYHADVIKLINEAIEHEEKEDVKKTVELYDEALEYINELFKMPIELPDNYEEVKREWDDACDKIQVLKVAKGEIVFRLQKLKKKISNMEDCIVQDTYQRSKPEITDSGPSAKKAKEKVNQYHSIYDGTGTGSTKTYKQIIKGLRDVIASKKNVASFDTLFAANVKLYKIVDSGNVLALEGERSMSLAMLSAGGIHKYLDGLNFIQCSIPMIQNTQNSLLTDRCDCIDHCDDMIWVYPLVENVSPCYRTEYGAFIFPDMESATPGGAFGIMLSNENHILSDEEFNDLQQFFLDLLEAVLKDKIPTIKTPSSSDTSHVVSRNIITVADYISRAMIKSAEKTGELMVKATPHLLSKMKSAGSDPVEVPSSLKTSVEVAQQVTQVAAGVTGWVAGKVCAASATVGAFIAPHLQQHGANLLEKGFGLNSDEAKTKMDGALTIAAGAIEGFATLYNGLDASARILGQSLSDNSIKIIEHKYGQPAGDVAAGTLESLGNAFNVSQNVNYITPRGLVKKVAKNAGKGVVEDYQRTLRCDSQTIPAGLIYKDLRILKET